MRRRCGLRLSTRTPPISTPTTRLAGYTSEPAGWMRRCRTWSARSRSHRGSPVRTTRWDWRWPGRAVDAAIDAHEQALRLQPESTEVGPTSGWRTSSAVTSPGLSGSTARPSGAIPGGQRCTSASATPSGASVKQRRPSQRSARRSGFSLTRPRHTPISRGFSRRRGSRTTRSPSCAWRSPANRPERTRTRCSAGCCSSEAR